MKPNAEQTYQAESGKALRDFQEGRISFHEWQRLQRDAVTKFTETSQKQ